MYLNARSAKHQNLNEGITLCLDTYFDINIVGQQKTLRPAYADYLEIWELQTPGTLRSCPGL